MDFCHDVPLFPAGSFKILLIQPPIEDFYQTHQRIEPIGLAYLASSLKKKGFLAEILDCQSVLKKNPIKLPSSLSFLKDFYISGNLSPFRLFGNYYHFGLSYHEMEILLKKSDARIFGISSMFSTYHNEAIKIAEIIKSIDKENIVIFGGAHVSCCPEEVIENRFVDFVVIGEGEKSLCSLLRCIADENLSEIKNVDGIGYKENGCVKINPKKTWIDTLDSIPFPSRELLSNGAYSVGRKRITKVFTSRGCPFSCSFCSVKLSMGNSLRQRTPENILEEIIFCNKKFGIEAFDFEDDNLGYDKELFCKLLDLIIKNFGEKKLRLYAMNGILPSIIDKTVLDKMKKSGFENLNLTFTSLNDNIRNKLSRPDTLKEFENALDLAKNAGLKITAYLFLGVPGQTVSEMVDDLLYLAKTDALIGTSIFYPVPGTPLFEEYSQKGYFSPDDLVKLRGNAFPIETEEFSKTDIFTLFYLARILNFMKSISHSDKSLNYDGKDFNFINNQISAEKKLNENEIGLILLDLFFKEKEIYGIKLVDKNNSIFTYQLYKENCSQRVLEEFFISNSLTKAVGNYIKKTNII